MGIAMEPLQTGVDHFKSNEIKWFVLLIFGAPCGHEGMLENDRRRMYSMAYLRASITNCLLPGRSEKLQRATHPG
jgi:hypothetical protein